MRRYYRLKDEDEWRAEAGSAAGNAQEDDEGPSTSQTAKRSKQTGPAGGKAAKPDTAAKGKPQQREGTLAAAGLAAGKPTKAGGKGSSAVGEAAGKPVPAKGVAAAPAAAGNGLGASGRERAAAAAPGRAQAKAPAAASVSARNGAVGKRATKGARAALVEDDEGDEEAVAAGVEQTEGDAEVGGPLSGQASEEGEEVGAAWGWVHSLQRCDGW